MPTYEVRNPAAGPRLKRYSIISTSSFEEAHEAVAQVYLPHEVVPIESHTTKLRMSLNAVVDTRLTLGYITYGAPTLVTMPPAESCYHFNLTVAGSTLAERDDGSRVRTEARKSGAVLLPDRLNRVNWSPDAEQLILKIPRTNLENQLAELLGRPVRSVVNFDYAVDLTRPAGGSVLSSVEFLARELDKEHGIADLPHARRQLELYIVTQLLEACHHQYSNELRSNQGDARPRRLRTVLDHLEANIASPLTVADLARAGNMSVRTLQNAFQREFGVPATIYLRNFRLDRAREAIRYTDCSDVRISDIAMQWGFFHLGRFAGYYRDRFGEVPSQTVARARVAAY